MTTTASASTSSEGGFAQAFIQESRSHLVDEYVPKIKRCLGELDGQSLWWRPNPASNAVGNLVLHLCGNATQWILHGVLGEPDTRERDSEFAAPSQPDSVVLTELLDRTAASIQRGFDEIGTRCAQAPGYLAEPRLIQGIDVTVLGAVYHVVEHFSQHTGQIMYVTKLRTADDLGFWTVADGIAKPNW